MKTKLFKTFLLLFAFVICANTAFAQLNVSLSFSSYNGFNVSCFGGTNGWVTATPSGGTSPYSYQWSNSATTQTISNIAASYYVVTVTDAASNTATAGVTMREPTQLSVSLTSPTYSNGFNISCFECFNGSITNTTSGGATSYTFLWSDAATTQNRSSVSGKGYMVTATDANSCTATGNISLTEPARDDWQMVGNSGSNPSTHYIGTSDNTDLVVKTNATERMRLTSGGQHKVLGDSRVQGKMRVDSMRFDPDTLVPSTYRMVMADTDGNLKTFTAGPAIDITGQVGRCAATVFPWNAVASSSNSIFKCPLEGNVGIGTANPSQKLEVAHNDANGGIVLNRLNSTVSKSQITFQQNGVEKWSIGNNANGNVSDPTNDFFIHGGNSPQKIRLYIDADGRMGINVIPTTTSSLYKLFVDGGIVTRDVKVTTNNPMPDYVFEEKYSLLSLTELEQFIKANKHLPEIPSAKEVERNDGFEVGDMQTRLLKKVEELTLYIIEQQKQMDAMKKELAAIKTK